MFVLKKKKRRLRLQNNLLIGSKGQSHEKKHFFFIFFTMKQTSRHHFDFPLMSSPERKKKNIREAITAKTVSLRLPSINYSSATASPPPLRNPPAFPTVWELIPV